jgi:probable DNA metabolism protein
MIQPTFEKTFEGWRTAARELLQKGVPPGEIQWSDEMPSLFSAIEFSPAAEPSRAFAVTQLQEAGLSPSNSSEFRVPPEFLNLAQAIAYARDDDRFAFLYRILFRLKFENSNLLKIAVDSDMLRAHLLSKGVRRDIHKMHAFVRFKETFANDEPLYVAWHKPEHLTVRPGTPFFARRFGDRRWSIFTPEESAHWDLQTLTFGPGMEQHEFHARDDWDELWKTYYKSIFNPSRIKMKMMKKEMSPKYWSSMPETSLIQELVREAPQRLQSMAKNQNRAAEVAHGLSLDQLRESTKACRACPLFAPATQTIFGSGPATAQLMIVGEQPGDQEDISGKPFVGPAGELLSQLLREAGIVREAVYVTNAVKHFKYEQQGKMRLHKKPSGSEMHACKPWLEAEIAALRPKIILALGATAATAILGRLPKISSERGRLFHDSKLAPAVLISWHPAAVLRAASESESAQKRGELLSDLTAIRILSEEKSPRELSSVSPD